MFKPKERLAKITLPRVSGILPRKRLFKQLDQSLQKPITFVTAPGGSGKTTVVADYLRERKLPCLWYQMDEGDADLATFFYYLRLAASGINPRKAEGLPLLTPEYLQSVNVFAGSYFEKLFNIPAGSKAKNKPEAAARPNCHNCIIFDNYQEVPEDSYFHNMLVKGFELIPEGLSIVVISRNEPHPAFARLKANNKTSLLRWEEVRFTLEETKALVGAAGKLKLGKEAVAGLYKRTEGWIAGLILATELLKREGLKEEGIQGFSLYESFDYFAGEVFDKMERETQRFLLETSFLSKITPALADRLTGLQGADKRLSWLSRRNYFTQRYSFAEPFYQYHPLFRDFLANRAESYFEKEELAQLQRTAATLLEETGQTEDAARLFHAAGDVEGLSRLIFTHALSMIVQGRNKTLEEWITRIPEEKRDNSPWHLYWLGSCRFPFNPVQARAHMEKAFCLFDKEKDAAGVFLAWAAIIDTYMFTWEYFEGISRWIEELYGLRERYKAIPSPEIEARVATNMFTALTYNQPHHPDMGFWENRAMEILKASPDNNIRLQIGSAMISWHCWSGDYAKATFLVNELQEAANSPGVTMLVKILFQTITAVYGWYVGAFEVCFEAIESGLKLAQDSGIHIFDFTIYCQGVYANCLKGDYEAASEYLKKIESILDRRKPMDLSHFQFLSMFLALAKGDLSLAAQRGENSIIFQAVTGAPYALALNHNLTANVHIEAGDYPAAEAHLSKAYSTSLAMKSKTLEYMCLISKAHLSMEKGEEKACLAYMDEALSLADTMGFVNVFFTRRPTMSRLCAKTLEAGVKTERVQELIQKFNLLPPDATSDKSPYPPFAKGGRERISLENWPYPIKIYTLGGFAIIINGKPVVFTGKVQQKPLQLLKALVSFGGREITREWIMDSLWPEAQGDMADNSQNVNFWRLKKLLGHEAAVKLTAGSLGIDRRYCWVDIWAVEHIIEEVKDRLRLKKIQKSDKGIQKSDERPDLEDRVNKVLDLYKGPFLPADAVQPWIVSARENIKEKVLRLISVYGQRCSDAGELERAVEIYRRGLEVDDMVEELYQGLMLCHARLGRKPEAIKDYRRCCSVFEAAFGIEPSERTQKIYQGLIKKG